MCQHNQHHHHSHDGHDGHGVMSLPHSSAGHSHTLVDSSDPCAAIVGGEYDLAFHIAAVFIIMGASFLGTLLPIIGKRFIRSDAGKLVITSLKLFGAGVILATALEASLSLDKSIIAQSGQVDNSADEMVHHEGHTHGGGLIHVGEKQLTVYLLELGIASHSIIIGLTLGISTDEFNTLLVALCFHQFFEGIALSAIVMEADFKKWSMTFYMVIFYTLTTPFGIAIGILIQQSYNANATATLLSTGILDALSAGILIYDVLVNVVAPHFTADNFHNASPIFKFIQLVTMYMGCATMSLIGYWA
ncbi:hypothetical protein BASA81_016998 [Batrachochytrium salamandrivorans]|nr:hypothetical protein BASA81_016998 [Batrachochytrium salamandrivorans]